MRRRYHFVLLNDIVTTTNPLLPLRPTPPPEGSFSPSLSLALHPSRRREKDGDGELRGGAQRREAPQRRHPRPERHRLRRLRAHRRRPPGLQRLRQPRLHLPPRLPPLPLPPRSPLLPQDDAVAVNQHPFKRSTAFLVGNEGTGLSAKECEICDFFVYIPQYGSGTASLNVTVAASIVLHHFAVWAGFSERIRDGNKFVVAEKPAKQVKRNFCAETVDAIIEERKSRKQNASEFFDGDGNAQSSSNLLEGLFSDDQ